jgi:hypothetical protein
VRYACSLWAKICLENTVVAKGSISFSERCASAPFFLWHTGSSMWFVRIGGAFSFSGLFWDSSHSYVLVRRTTKIRRHQQHQTPQQSKFGSCTLPRPFSRANFWVLDVFGQCGIAVGD